MCVCVLQPGGQAHYVVVCLVVVYSLRYEWIMGELNQYKLVGN